NWSPFLQYLSAVPEGLLPPSSTSVMVVRWIWLCRSAEEFGHSRAVCRFIRCTAPNIHPAARPLLDWLYSLTGRKICETHFAYLLNRYTALSHWYASTSSWIL